MGDAALARALGRTRRDNVLFNGDVDACFRWRSFEGHRRRLANVKPTIDMSSGIRILKPAPKAGKKGEKHSLGSKIVKLICSVVKPVFVDFDGEKWLSNILEKDVEEELENEDNYTPEPLPDSSYDDESGHIQNFEEAYVHNQREEGEEKK